MFRKQPLLVGLTPDAPTPGSYFTHEAADTGLIIVRGDDNVVRAFVNACRHRGTRIAEGRGTKRTFSCPFHAWNYARDGKLISRPNSCGGFDSTGDEFGALLQKPCIEVAGMIFVLLEGTDIETKVRRLVGEVAHEIESYAIGENDLLRHAARPNDRATTSSSSTASRSRITSARCTSRRSRRTTTRIRASAIRSDPSLA